MWRGPVSLFRRRLRTAGALTLRWPILRVLDACYEGVEMRGDL